MKKEAILTIMIGMDWVSHIFEQIEKNLFPYTMFHYLTRLIGYHNFWIIYWGVAVCLAFSLFYPQLYSKMIERRYGWNGN
jgi:hypothetical protein